MNINIEFNQEIIKKMRSLNLSVDLIGSILFVLFALYEGRFDLLDEFDDINRERRAILLYRLLERREFLERADEVNPVEYILTKKGYDLIEFAKSQFGDTVFTNPAQDLEAYAIKENTVYKPVESWIKDYIQLFPKGEYFGRPLRTNFREVNERMTWFMETYKFDKDTILEATSRYLDSQQTYQYTLSSTTFIWKCPDGSRKVEDRISALASFCEGVIEDKDKPNNQLYSESL